MNIRLTGLVGVWIASGIASTGSSRFSADTGNSSMLRLPRLGILYLVESRHTRILALLSCSAQGLLDSIAHVDLMITGSHRRPHGISAALASAFFACQSTHDMNKPLNPSANVGGVYISSRNAVYGSPWRMARWMTAF